MNTIKDVCEPRSIDQESEPVKLFYFSPNARKLTDLYKENKNICILSHKLRQLLETSTDKKLSIKSFTSDYLNKSIEYFEMWMEKFRDGSLTLKDIDEFLNITENKQENRNIELKYMKEYFSKKNNDIKNLESTMEKISIYSDSKKLLSLIDKLLKIVESRKLKGDFSKIVEFKKKV